MLWKIGMMWPFFRSCGTRSASQMERRRSKSSVRRAGPPALRTSAGMQSGPGALLSARWSRVDLTSSMVGGISSSLSKSFCSNSSMTLECAVSGWFRRSLKCYFQHAKISSFSVNLLPWSSLIGLIPLWRHWKTNLTAWKKDLESCLSACCSTSLARSSHHCFESNM